MVAAAEEVATQPTQAAAGDTEMAGEHPCLMIKQLELTNFKSYANTVTIGPFDRHMTSVVGPNGSGKSNVIDAMLFVFGFKANKCALVPSLTLAPRVRPRLGAPQHPGCTLSV